MKHFLTFSFVGLLLGVGFLAHVPAAHAAPDVPPAISAQDAATLKQALDILKATIDIIEARLAADPSIANREQMYATLATLRQSLHVLDTTLNERKLAYNRAKALEDALLAQTPAPAPAPTPELEPAGGEPLVLAPNPSDNGKSANAQNPFGLVNQGDNEDKDSEENLANASSFDFTKAWWLVIALPLAYFIIRKVFWSTPALATVKKDSAKSAPAPVAAAPVKMEPTSPPTVSFVSSPAPAPAAPAPAAAPSAPIVPPAPTTPQTNPTNPVF